MGELTGKVAIVTGASKGIGAAIARAFAKAGAAVTVNYASNKADADRVVGEIVKAGGKAVAIQADVAKRADVQRLFAEIGNAQQIFARAVQQIVDRENAPFFQAIGRSHR